MIYTQQKQSHAPGANRDHPTQKSSSNRSANMAASSADSNQFYGSVSALSVRKQDSVDGISKGNPRPADSAKEAQLIVTLGGKHTFERPDVKSSHGTQSDPNEKVSQKSESIEILKAESALP